MHIPSHRPHGREERGVALIIALIMLVLMTLVGIAAIRGVTLEERMAGNTLDRSLSFQAAEDALRQGEVWVEANKPDITTNCNTEAVCAPAIAGAPVWEDPAITWKAGIPTTSGSLDDIQSQYLVEYLGNTFACGDDPPGVNDTCRRYRITARSNAGAGRAAVMLQSVYATE